jgi:cytochrome d ubiquinol oxidase subunit I
VQWPHVFFSGLATAGFFMMGIAAYRLVAKKGDEDFFRRSFRVAVVAAGIGSLAVGLVGHTQAQHMIQAQPMKMAAAEALWDSEDPAALSLFTISDMTNRRNVFAIRIPRALSLLAYNRLTGEVKGINDLQAEYEKQHGAGSYVPFVVLIYWSFRAMVGVGMLMVLLALIGLYFVLRGRISPSRSLFWRALPLVILLPYIANSAGWIMTEMGRQPWIVFGLLKTEDAVSPSVAGGAVLLSVLLFTAIYGVLMVADIYLLAKYAKADPAQVAADALPETAA